MFTSFGAACPPPGVEVLLASVTRPDFFQGLKEVVEDTGDFSTDLILLQLPRAKNRKILVFYLDLF